MHRHTHTYTHVLSARPTNHNLYLHYDTILFYMFAHIHCKTGYLYIHDIYITIYYVYYACIISTRLGNAYMAQRDWTLLYEVDPSLKRDM